MCFLFLRGVESHKHSWNLGVLLQADEVVSGGKVVCHMLDSTLKWAALSHQQVQTGVAQSDCSGEMVVPTDGGLVKGQAYYARVFAYSSVGFSMGQVASYPAQPTTVPGRPTSVSVDVYDAQSLKVVFSPPADDGGDTGDLGHVYQLT